MILLTNVGLFYNGLDVRLQDPQKVPNALWEQLVPYFCQDKIADNMQDAKVKLASMAAKDKSRGGYLFPENEKNVILSFFGLFDETECQAKIYSAIAEKAKEQFGVTSNWKLAGYLTIHGDLLDFSEGQNQRTMDHRQIDEILDLPDDANYSQGLIDFMNQGNVRIMVNNDFAGLDISVLPNEKQKKSLMRFFAQRRGEIYIDYSGQEGQALGTSVYELGTSASRIWNDIEMFFEKGTIASAA